VLLLLLLFIFPILLLHSSPYLYFPSCFFFPCSASLSHAVSRFNPTSHFAKKSALFFFLHVKHKPWLEAVCAFIFELGTVAKTYPVSLFHSAYLFSPASSFNLLPHLILIFLIFSIVFSFQSLFSLTPNVSFSPSFLSTLFSTLLLPFHPTSLFDPDFSFDASSPNLLYFSF
jgi:hypothetical protein